MVAAAAADASAEELRGVGPTGGSAALDDLRPRKTIAILVPSTTKGTYISDASELPLFEHLLPTLLTTVDCVGERYVYHYVIYLGFDVGDQFYDDAANLAAVRARFTAAVADATGAGTTVPSATIALRIYRASGMGGAPCWLWNTLAARAYDTRVSRAARPSGGYVDYLYQTNDDIEFLTACWAEDFVVGASRSPSRSCCLAHRIDARALTCTHPPSPPTRCVTRALCHTHTCPQPSSPPPSGRTSASWGLSIRTTNAS